MESPLFLSDPLTAHDPACNLLLHMQQKVAGQNAGLWEK
jgi:hypothetical protein